MKCKLCHRGEQDETPCSVQEKEAKEVWVCMKCNSDTFFHLVPSAVSLRQDTCGQHVVSKAAAGAAACTKRKNYTFILSSP